MKNFIRTLLLVLLVTCTQTVAAQALSSPAQAADKFYRAYLKLKIRGLPNDKEMKVLSPLITSDLKDLFEAARKIQAKFIQEHPDEKGPWVDGDLFTSLFEGAQSFQVGRPTVHQDQAEVPVQLTYRQGGSTTRWSDVLILERNRSKWLVRDILLKGEWAFKSGESLRTILSSR
jgi:hypothetical protein